MEELNQVQTDDIFDDFEEEETTETPEETSEEISETPKAFLKVRYNDEDRDLNEDDARMYAQKGMNYDRIYEPLEKLARANNMQVGEYLNQLNATQEQYEISKEVDNLKADPKYEELSDEILEEIAGSRVREKLNLQTRKLEEEKNNQDAALEKEFTRQVDMFKREYPDIEPNDVDQEVFDYVKEGYTLLEAYNKWSSTNSKQKAAKQNEENRKRSLGNTTNAGKVEADDFLSGFLNG